MSVSVVITSHNRGRLLREAVESVLRQTYPDVELIIVDDGSLDAETQAILDELLARGLRVIRQENSGPSAARNTGIREAGGAAILCLDDDDLIGPDYAALAFEQLERASNVGVVYCHADHIGSRTGAWRLDEFSPSRLALGNCVFSAAFFRRKDWEAVGGYDENLWIFEDWDFWIRLCMLGRDFKQLPETHFFRRVGHESLLHTASMGDGDGPQRRASVRRQIFLKNLPFFRDHVEAIETDRLRLEEEVRRWRKEYGAIDHRFGNGIKRWYPRARGLKRTARKFLDACRGQHISEI